MGELPEHVARNRLYWDERSPEYAAEGRRNWEAAEPHWGSSRCRRRRSGCCRGSSRGGTRSSSAAAPPTCRRGWRGAARAVGIDNSEAQLGNARAFQEEFGIEFPLVFGNAERVPFPDESFDLAISEYGASIWCDPYEWIPEAARLLRPGGELVFLVNSVLSILCGLDDGNLPAGEELLRPLFGMHRLEWPDDDSVEFHLPQGKMIELLRDCGLTVEELIEVRPPADATTRFAHISLDWARRFPCEEVWRARKPG
jgi:SAM-dependent methyltransferase